MVIMRMPDRSVNLIEKPKVREKKPKDVEKSGTPALNPSTRRTLSHWVFTTGARAEEAAVPSNIPRIAPHTAARMRRLNLGLFFSATLHLTDLVLAVNMW